MSGLTFVELDLLRELRHLDARAAPDLADWLVTLEGENKADRTIQSYRLGIAKLLRLNMDKAVDEFTASDINAWIVSYPRGSREVIRSMGSKFFEWLEMDERITTNPYKRVVKVKPIPRAPINIFSDAERAQLEGLEAPHGQLFSLLFGSGIRKQGAIGLRWQDVDLDRERMVVTEKGRKARIVPLLDFAVVALAELDRWERFAADDHVFFCTHGPRTKLRREGWHSRKQPLGSTPMHNWYVECLRDAGVRHRKLHTTRHTYNEILRGLDYDLEERSLLLGHADTKVTAKQYGHLTIEDVARKMRGLR